MAAPSEDATIAAAAAAATAATATAAVARRFGAGVVLREIEKIGEGRSTVWRARAVLPDGTTYRVIVKATAAADFDATAADAFQKFGAVREWSALSFLAGHAPDAHGAPWLGGDPASGVIVLGDLGRDIPSLVDKLLHGSAQQAEAALLAHAIALGRLHAGTVNCRDAHAAAVHATFPAATVPLAGATWAERARTTIGRFGGAVPDADIALISAHLRDPRHWLALLHADPCPDNVLLTEGGATLIDFEFSAPAHALFDAVYARMGFPTCWCAGRIPDDVLARVEGGYRASVASGIQAAADDRHFAAETAIVCTAWLFESLDWLGEAALQDDRVWGRATTRSRILHYLQAAIRATEQADSLPDVRRLAAEWLARLRTEWPEVVPLEVYPAFAAA